MTEKSIRALGLEAQARGEKTFDAGIPCVNGHVALRRARGIMRCVECIALDGAKDCEKRKIAAAVRAQDAEDAIMANPYAPMIISRSDARDLGLTRYFTGKACSKGHIEERLISSNQCMACARIKKLAQSKGRKYYLPEPDADGIIRNARPCPKCGCTERYEKQTRCTGCTKIWNKVRKSTPEKKKKYYDTSYAKNKKQYLANAWLRKKRIKDATPKNMSDEEKQKMVLFFKLCPEGYQIDHIVPLTSDVVCGCHCLVNLQYLPKSENRSKSNRWPTCQKSSQPACFDSVDYGVKG